MVQNFILYLLFTIGYGMNGLAKAQNQIIKSQIPQNEVLKKAIEESGKLGREEKYDSLHIVIQKNLPVSIRLNDSLSIGNLRFYQGYYYRGKGNFSKAIVSLEESITIFQKMNKLPDLARAMYTLNIVHADDGNREEAIRMGMENIKFFEKTKQAKQLKSTYILLSMLFEELKNNEMALHFDKEFSKYSNLEFPEFEYLKLYSIADTYKKQGNYRAELQYLKKALAALRLTKFATPIINSLTTIARYYVIHNRIQEAVPYFDEALQIAKSIHNNVQLADVYYEMAMMHLKLRNNTTALNFITKATTLAREDKTNTYLLVTLEGAAYIEEQTGHYKQALKTIKEINIRKDSLLNKERLKFTADASAKYELGKKENNIALLNKENRLQVVLAKANQIKMKASDQKTYFLFSIVFMLSLLVLVIAYFYYKSQKLRTQLANQQDILKVQAKELAESNLLKDKMFSIISHDLRSPVGSLKASLTLLNSKNRNDVQLIRFEQQVDFLQYTLDNVLYWSLSQQKAISMTPQVVDLFEIVEEVAVSLSGLMQIKDINLILPQTSVPLLVDEQLLTIVLRNILHNAIKFTPRNGNIAMSILSDGGSTQIQIKDTGIGFSSGNDKKSRQHGTGLGLNLSRELMKRNNGELKISSIPNEGTTVQLCWQNDQECAHDTMLAESLQQD